MAFTTLGKAKKLLKHSQKLYKGKKKKISSDLQKRFEDLLTDLHEAIRNKNKEKAAALSVEIQDFTKKFLPKTFLDQVINLVTSLAFALVIAIIIRQMWFEFYTIPTGSMRPTFKEGDYLVVSKNDFGLNIPLRASHFYFNPDLVTRGSTMVFTTANMDVQDAETKYFYIIPGRKQFIKRLIGKPGDTLYFYGGNIYGIDKEGSEITDFGNDPWFTDIEHIPFIRFDGKVLTPHLPVQGIYTPSILYQMNEPVAKLSLNSYGRIEGEMLIPKNKRKNVFPDYYDLWGFRNFATARILTKKQLENLSIPIPPGIENTPLYLEFTHHPSMDPSKLIRDEYHRTRPGLTYSTSILPLDEKHLRNIMNHIYTSRFIVKNGKAHRYGSAIREEGLVPLKGVPDGTYEFQDGVLYQVLWGGIQKKLPKDHPLYDFNPQRVQMLFNLGIEFDTYFKPGKNTILTPSRYAYFRNHQLFLMGAPIYSEEDVLLTHFLEREYQKQKETNYSYHPFEDMGPPFKKDGSLDKKLIEQYGLKVPHNMYLALGDNHALSGDSRAFGFVPQENLKGRASFVFWPPTSWGMPLQSSVKSFSLPKVFTWAIFIIIMIICYLFYRKRKMLPPKF